MDERTWDEAGISSLGMILSMAGLLAVLLIVAIVVSLTLPSSTTTTTTTTIEVGGTVQSTTATTAGVTTTTTVSGTGAAAAVAACHSDVSDVQVALAAYQASTGSYPTPPAAWSAATYPSNFSPLTNAPAPGPYLKMPPGDNDYVVLWDSAGHIWVEPPGTFTATYDAAHDGSNPTTCSTVAR